MKNHLGTFECKLCLTLHPNEGNYLAHTQGKKHQDNLGRRAIRERKEGVSVVQQQYAGLASRSLAPNLLFLINPLYCRGTIIRKPVRLTPKIGPPQCHCSRHQQPDSGQYNMLFMLQYPDIADNVVPRYRFMSAFEQRVEQPDRSWQYILFAAEPYQTAAFKIPNREIERSVGEEGKELFWTHWDKERKVFYLSLTFKKQRVTDGDTTAHDGFDDGDGDAMQM